MGQSNSETQEKGLATFEDQENKLDSVVLELVPQPFQPNPYPGQTPKEICERWVQITTQTYSDSSSAQLAVVSGASILQEFFIQKALQTFRYLRFSHMEWRVQYHSTPFYYGWCALTCLPEYMGHNTQAISPGTVTNLDSVLQYASHTDSVLMDFSQQQDVIVRTPWLSPCQWIDLTNFYGAGAPSISALTNLHSLRIMYPPHAVKFINSTGISSITFQVFCRLQGVETAGPINDNSDPPKPLGGVIESQSKGSFMSGFDLSGSTFAAHDDMVLNGPGKGQQDARTPVQSHKATAQDDADEPELKPNVFGSLISTSAKYPLGSGTMLGPTRAHTLLEYMKIPTMFQQGVLSNEVALSFLAACIPSNYSRMNFLSQYFRFWRGSIKFTLVIFGSPFIAARYNVVLSYERTLGVPLGRLATELIKDVTVRGTTSVDIDVPFLSLSNWLPTRWTGSHSTTGTSITNNCVPSLWILPVQSPISSGDIDPSLPYVLYTAAGDDFQLRGLLNGNPSQLILDTIESQMYAMDMCKGKDLMSTGAVKPLPYGADVEVSFQDVMSRWTATTSDLLTPIPSMAIQTYPDVALNNWYTPVTVYDSFGCLFGFCSGQVKYKIPWDENTAAGAETIVVVLDDNFKFGPNDGPGVSRASVSPLFKAENGLTAIDIGITKVVEYTVPWMNVYEYLPTGISDSAFKGFFMLSDAEFWGDFQPIFYADNNSALDRFRVFRAAGPDFSLYYPLPPPLISNGYWIGLSAITGNSLSATSAQTSLVQPYGGIAPRGEKQKTIRRFLPAGAEDQRSDVRKEQSSEDEVAHAYAVLHKHNLLVRKENRNPLRKTCSLSDAV